MRPTGDSRIASASDLSDFLSCRYFTALKMVVVRSKRQRPYWPGPAS